MKRAAFLLVGLVAFGLGWVSRPRAEVPGGVPVERSRLSIVPPGPLPNPGFNLYLFRVRQPDGTTKDYRPRGEGEVWTVLVYEREDSEAVQYHFQAEAR